MAMAIRRRMVILSNVQKGNEVTMTYDSRI
jgi:hypothetical protein